MITQREIIIADDNYTPLLPIIVQPVAFNDENSFIVMWSVKIDLKRYRRYEDVIFCPFQYFKCHKILKIENKLYYYRINDKSITENIIDSDADSIFFAMRKMYNYINENSATRTIATLMIVNCFLKGVNLRKKKGLLSL